MGIRRHDYPNLPRTGDDVPRRDQPRTLVMWAWTHVDDVIDAHMQAAKATILQKSDPTPDHNHVFLLAAPNTRFREDTDTLLKLQFPEAKHLHNLFVGNRSIITAEKARRVLGW